MSAPPAEVGIRRRGDSVPVKMLSVTIAIAAERRKSSASRRRRC